jgi:succinate dehydrogenase / fumarate reductase cytochrome b subunit
MTVTSTNESFLDRNYFLLRRLHSLSGIVPIGAFLFPHLLTNSSIVWGSWLNKAHYGHGGVESFQHEVNYIHNLPFLILIEWGVLFLPILLHAALGVWFALSGRMNALAYGYGGNRRYTLQRLTGYLGVLFIFMHITSLRFGEAVPMFTYGGLMPTFAADAAASSTAIHFQNGVWGWFATVFYLVCVLGLVFHFANGLWTAAITWGLTISEAAQKRWGYVCAVIGIGLGIAAILAVIGFTTLDIEQARQIETTLATGAH